jgi:hypothetical protein
MVKEFSRIQIIVYSIKDTIKKKQEGNQNTQLFIFYYLSKYKDIYNYYLSKYKDIYN